MGLDRGGDLGQAFLDFSDPKSDVFKRVSGALVGRRHVQGVIIRNEFLLELAQKLRPARRINHSRLPSLCAINNRVGQPHQSWRTAGIASSNWNAAGSNSIIESVVRGDGGREPSGKFCLSLLRSLKDRRSNAAA